MSTILTRLFSVVLGVVLAVLFYRDGNQFAAGFSTAFALSQLADLAGEVQKALQKRNKHSF